MNFSQILFGQKFLKATNVIQRRTRERELEVFPEFWGDGKVVPQ